MPQKPIRIFYSEMTKRFYASNKYKEEEINGLPRIIITGDKFDVTNDIGNLVTKYQITFTESNHG